MLVWQVFVLEVCDSFFIYAFIKAYLEFIWRGMSKSKLYWLGAPVAYLLSSERDLIGFVLNPSEIFNWAFGLKLSLTCLLGAVYG